MRKPGPIKVSEVKAFQKRWKLQVDGKFGNQSMGQCLTLEMQALEVDNLRRSTADLNRKLNSVNWELAIAKLELDKPWWKRLFGW